MDVQLVFGMGVACALLAWSVFGTVVVWPWLRERPRLEALRPLLMLHVFRFIGLSFLVPGVVAADLPMSFARSAAWGDLLAMALALLTLASLRSRMGLALAWIFNVWGSFDLLNAFYQAMASGLSPSQFGAAYFLPTFLVPMLMVSHVLVFRILWRPAEVSSGAGKSASSLAC